MTLRASLGHWLNQRALRVHRSRLGWREAPKYTRHWKRCQSQDITTEPWHRNHAAELWRNGSTSFVAYKDHPWFWISRFLEAAFLSRFAVYYGKTYASEWSEMPSGSQLWHADGGPGTCINVMVYRTNVTRNDGPLEVVRWKRSLELFAQEPSMVSRDALCAWYSAHIKTWDYTTYTGPIGTVIAFLNNTIHRGGYPMPGHTREVSVYHCYPSLRGPMKLGGEVIVPDKVASYPKDPDI